ncbi:MAG: hypothetical protein L0Z53_04755 [Acidobacteriales bacterium]|nr:hypothetical protein [Terriglobales bacterium]
MKFRKLTCVLLLLVTFMLLLSPQAALAGPCTDQLDSDFGACTNAFAWYDPRREACYAGAMLMYGACILEALVT